MAAHSARTCTADRRRAGGYASLLLLALEPTPGLVDILTDRIVLPLGLLHGHQLGLLEHLHVRRGTLEVHERLVRTLGPVNLGDTRAVLVGVGRRVLTSDL